mgnify:CR=1 FL=1
MLNSELEAVTVVTVIPGRDVCHGPWPCSFTFCRPCSYTTSRRTGSTPTVRSAAGRRSETPEGLFWTQSVPLLDLHVNEWYAEIPRTTRSRGS